jgi:hypothetical protein
MIEDKKTTEPMIFIDINSEHLREILKVVLEGVEGINLREDKLFVRHNLRHNLLKFTEILWTYPCKGGNFGSD